MRKTMPEILKELNNPDKIAEAGERIYSTRHKEKLERESPGKFVAIDVATGNAYVGEFPEAAIQDAKAASPNAVLHLIRIGAEGAFKVSYAGSRSHPWRWGRSLRQTR